MTSALVLVDAQANMLEGDDAVPAARPVRRVLEDLLGRARQAGAPVVHVQNDGGPGEPDEPFTDGWALVFDPEVSEVVVRKDRGDAFAANPNLAGHLRDRGVETVVIAGMQSEFCVEATSLGALREGFAVVLPQDAHATYDNGATPAADTSHTVERSLAAHGVRVMPAASVGFG